MPKAEEVGSFLSFLYHIRFNPEYRQRFTWPKGYDRTSGVLPPRQDGQKHTYEQVMDEFQLTPSQRALMVAVDWAMASPDPMERARADELWRELVEQLIPEFRAWTEGGSSYGWAPEQDADAAAKAAVAQAEAGAKWW